MPEIGALALDPFAKPRELLLGVFRHGGGSSIPLGPWPGLDPLSQIEHGAAKTIRPDGGHDAGIGRRAPRLEFAMGPGQSFVGRMAGLQGGENVRRKDIEIARRTKLARNPFEPGLDGFHLVADDVGKNGNGGAQPPETDAHLV